MVSAYRVEIVTCRENLIGAAENRQDSKLVEMADAREKEQRELDRKKEINLERAWIQICEREDLMAASDSGSNAERMEDLCRINVPRVYQGVQKENRGEKTAHSAVNRARRARSQGYSRAAGEVAGFVRGGKEEPENRKFEGVQVDARIEKEGPCRRAVKTLSEAGTKGGRSTHFSASLLKGEQTTAVSLTHPPNCARRTLEKKKSIKPLSETSPNRMFPSEHRIREKDIEKASTRFLASPSLRIRTKAGPWKEDVLPETRKVLTSTSCSEKPENVIIVQPCKVGSPMSTAGKPTVGTLKRAQRIDSSKIGSPSRVPTRTENRMLTAYSYRVVEDAFKMSQQSSVSRNSCLEGKNRIYSGRRHVLEEGMCSNPENSDSSLGRIMSFVLKFFCCGYDAFSAQRATGRFQNKLKFQRPVPIVDMKSRHTTPPFEREKVSSVFDGRQPVSPLKQKKSSHLCPENAKVVGGKFPCIGISRRNNEVGEINNKNDASASEESSLRLVRIMM